MRRKRMSRKSNRKFGKSANGVHKKNNQFAKRGGLRL
jgi:hypothetical protein